MFKLQNLQQSTWNYEILCADKSSTDKQLKIKIIFVKNKNTYLSDA
jgi:hypothetical protein